MSVDPNSPVPIFLQIADHIRRSVAAGVYRPGEMIPSLRLLARELAVNPNTVQRAYEHLEREGLIQARKGLGMFVSDNGQASAQTKSEESVYQTFTTGVQAARAANMPSAHIRSTFERAIRDTDEHQRNDP
ncbi:MAG: GntR family transcriptional regulator [Phycisphaerae bacterium]